MSRRVDLYLMWWANAEPLSALPSTNVLHRIQHEGAQGASHGGGGKSDGGMAARVDRSRLQIAMSEFARVMGHHVAALPDDERAAIRALYQSAPGGRCAEQDAIAALPGWTQYRFRKSIMAARIRLDARINQDAIYHEQRKKQDRQLIDLQRAALVA